MFIRNRLKRDNSIDSFLNSRNVKKTKIKKSNSSIDISSSKKYLQTSLLLNNYQESIYDNFRMNKASSIENSEKGIRKLSQEIKQKKIDEINQMYKIKLKTSFYSKFGNLYLTNTSSSKIQNKKTTEDSMLQNSTTVVRNELFNNSSAVISDNYSTNNSSDLPPIENIDFSAQKIEFKIRELYGDKKTGKQLANCSRNMYMIKNYMNIKKDKLNQELALQNNLIEQEKLTFSSLMNNKNYLLEKFCTTYDSYIKFLRTKIHNEKTKLEELSEKQTNSLYEVNNLLGLVIKKQAILEEYVQSRDFLLKIKLKRAEMPFSYIKQSYLDTKIEEVGSTINSLQSKINMLIVEKFMKHYNYLHKYMKRRESIEKGRDDECLIYNDYIKRNIAIFNDVDEFMQNLNELEAKNMLLLEENEKIRHEMMEYQLSYANLNQDSERYTKFLDTQIDIKQRHHNELLNRNKKLRYKIKYFTSTLNNSTINTTISNKEKIKQFSGTFINKENINFEKYQTLLLSYPYQYSYVVKKLFFFIENIIKAKYFSLNYDKIFTYIKPEDYYKYMNMKFNENNKDKIIYICKQLLLIYEIIIEFIQKKHKEYLLNPKLKEKTLALVIENQKNSKLQNARMIRKFIEDKRNVLKEDIIKKNRKVIFLEGRKCKEFPMLLSKNKNKYKHRNKSVELVDTNNVSFENLLQYTSD